jgi:hypothetical protein
MRRHNSVIANSDRRTSNLSLCRKIATFAQKRPDCEDAISTLYYMLNIADDNQMRYDLS